MTYRVEVHGQLRLAFLSSFTFITARMYVTKFSLIRLLSNQSGCSARNLVLVSLMILIYCAVGSRVPLYADKTQAKCAVSRWRGD